MADKALSEFVKESLQSGQKRDAITQALQQSGWKSDEIRAALDAYTDVDFPVAVPRPRPYLSAREAFLYLFFFILLGIVSYSLGSLLFGLINQMLPDEAAANQWQSVRSERQIRSGISGLVVSTPVFLFLANILRKSRRSNPDLQRSPHPQMADLSQSRCCRMYVGRRYDVSGLQLPERVNCLSGLRLKHLSLLRLPGASLPIS